MTEDVDHPRALSASRIPNASPRARGASMLAEACGRGARSGSPTQVQQLLSHAVPCPSCPVYAVQQAGRERPAGLRAELWRLGHLPGKHQTD